MTTTCASAATGHQVASKKAPQVTVVCTHNASTRLILNHVASTSEKRAKSKEGSAASWHPTLSIPDINTESHISSDKPITLHYALCSHLKKAR